MYLIKKLFVILLILQLCVIVFDPSNSITGAKEYLFIAIFTLWFIGQTTTNKLYKNKYMSYIIFSLFSIIFPMISIFLYYFQGGDLIEYEGFKVFFGFLAFGMLFLIRSNEILALRLFVNILTLQAFATIFIYLILSLNTELIEKLTKLGYEYGFLWINNKSYGDYNFLQVFFKTSPLMVLPLAYYSSGYFGGKDIYNGNRRILLIITFLALMISGTRANIAFAIIIPAFFMLANFKNISISKKIYIIIFSLLFIVALSMNASVILAMLDSNEFSNAVKIGYWPDYIELFSDPNVLLFGQGIGVPYYFNSLGLSLFITELTYFELFRNFGMVVGFFYIVFWIAPIFLLQKMKFANFRWVQIAYSSYLLIAFTNYYMLSSTGMFFLSIIYALCFARSNKNNIELTNFSIHGHD